MVLLVLRATSLSSPELTISAFDTAKDEHEGVVERVEGILAERGEGRPLDVKLPGGRFMTAAESKLPVLTEAISRRDESSRTNRLSKMCITQPATSDRLQALVSALSLRTRLIVLELDRTDLHSVGPLFLLDALRSIPSLRALRLTACRLAQQHVDQIAACFASGEAALLEELSLARNSLPATSLHPLLLALASSTTHALHLRTLDLSDNRLSSAGLALLCNVLRAARIPLSHLDLSGCPIPVEARATLDAAVQSPHLAHLVLDNCALSDEHVVSMSSHLEANTSLARLSLSANACSPAASKALASSLAASQNQTLVDLNLSHTNVGASFYDDWMPLLSSPACRLATVRMMNSDILPRDGVEWIAGLTPNGSLTRLEIDANLLAASSNFALKQIEAVTARNLRNRQQQHLTLFDRACKALRLADVEQISQLPTPLCQSIASSLVAQKAWDDAFEERSFSQQFGI